MPSSAPGQSPRSIGTGADLLLYGFYKLLAEPNLRGPLQPVADFRARLDHALDGLAERLVLLLDLLQPAVRLEVDTDRLGGHVGTPCVHVHGISGGGPLALSPVRRAARLLRHPLQLL